MVFLLGVEGAVVCLYVVLLISGFFYIASALGESDSAICPAFQHRNPLTALNPGAHTNMTFLFIAGVFIDVSSLSMLSEKK